MYFACDIILKCICLCENQTFKESGDAYAHIDAKHTRRGENDWDEIEDVIGDVELEVAEEVRVAQNRAAAAAAAAGNAAAAAAPLQNGVGPAGPHHDAQEPVDPERLQVCTFHPLDPQLNMKPVPAHQYTKKGQKGMVSAAARFACTLCSNFMPLPGRLTHHLFFWDLL